MASRQDREQISVTLTFISSSLSALARQYDLTRTRKLPVAIPPWSSSGQQCGVYEGPCHHHHPHHHLIIIFNILSPGLIGFLFLFIDLEEVWCRQQWIYICSRANGRKLTMFVHPTQTSSRSRRPLFIWWGILFKVALNWGRIQTKHTLLQKRGSSRVLCVSKGSEEVSKEHLLGTDHNREILNLSRPFSVVCGACEQFRVL